MIVPKGWSLIKLGAITAQKSVKNSARTINNVVSVTKYKGIVNSLEYFKKQVYSKNTNTYKIIHRGDFAYATIHLDEGSIGRLEICDEAILSPMYTVFSIDEAAVDGDFLIALLKSDRLMNIYAHIGSGTVERRKAISYKTFSEIEVLLPPLSEQKRIAAILKSSDDAIVATQKVIDQTEKLSLNKQLKLKQEQLKLSLTQDLLTGKVSV